VAEVPVPPLDLEAPQPSPEAIQAALDVALRSTAQDDEEARLDIAAELRAAYAIDCVPALRDARQRVTDTLAALQVIGIEPPEFPGEPWSLLVSEEPEPGDDTAEETARLFMVDLTERELKAEAALAAAVEREGRYREALESARSVAGKAYSEACADGCDNDAAHDASMDALSKHIGGVLGDG
jgi:hypothetical protein